MNFEYAAPGHRDVGPGEDVGDVPRREEANHHRQHRKPQPRLDHPRAQGLMRTWSIKGALVALIAFFFVFAADLSHQFRSVFTGSEAAAH